MRVSGWLFLVQQGVCSLGLLVALGQAAGLSGRHPGRVLLVALGCAGAALGAALGRVAWVRGGVLVGVLVVAPAVAWPGVPRRIRWQLGVLHGVLGLTLAGWARLAAGLGVWPPLVPPLAVALLCAVTPLLRRAEPPRCVTAEIRFGGHRITLTALIDSGNLLRDPVTGLPVIVISRRAAARLTMLPPPGRLSPGMRLLSVRTIAGTTLMAVFRPSAVFLEVGGAWRAVSAMVGLAPDGYEGFQALVPVSLLGNAGAAEQEAHSSAKEVF